MGKVLILLLVLGVGALLLVYGVTGCARSSEELFSAATTETDAQQRDEAAGELAELVDAGLASRMVDAANGGNELAVQSAATMVARYRAIANPPATTADGNAASAVPDDRKVAAVRCLGAMKTDGAVAALATFMDESTPACTRAESVTQLGGIDSAASTQALIAGLHNADVQKPIGDLLLARGAKVVQPLIDARKNDENLSAAMDVLVRLGEPAVDPLLAISGDGSDWTGDTLARIGQPAVTPLLQRMASDDHDTRFAAATVLTKMVKYNPSCVEQFIDALNNGDTQAIAEHYPFFIKLGREGTEGLLIDALNGYGDTTMCVDYLNCDNDQLEKGGEHWAHAHGYDVQSQVGFHGGPIWGEGVK